MSDVKWIKITTTMFEDEKIDFIESLPEADGILVVWIKLLTMAGRNNSNGFIFLTEQIPYTPEMLAHKFRRPLNTVKLALETLRKLEMITFDDDGFLKITNWEKHQNIEGLDKIREQTRLRVAKYREKKELIESNVTCNATVTHGNATEGERELELEGELDLELEKEREKELEGELKREGEKEKKKAPSPKQTKKITPKKEKCGEFKKVSLAKEEYKKLVDRLGKAWADDLIVRLDLYKESTGKTYKSDYATILNWSKKESYNQRPKKEERKNSNPFLEILEEELAKERGDIVDEQD